MTFGALAAWQAWLVLGAAAALAAGLFLVRLRPPRTLVPSLLLWRRVLDERREQTLWERIRRAVSLVLTVLIALALALAAVRPGRSPVGGQSQGGRLLVVLDASWSMQARVPGGGTRWMRAVAEARRLFAGAAGTDMALATTADGLVEGPTTDLALIEAALDEVAPGGGDATGWPRLAGATAVHFITDGATARALDPAVAVHTVFEPADNVAVTAFAVRPSLTPGAVADAYLEVANFAGAAQKVRVRIDRGEVTALDREFDVGPAETLRQTLPVPPGGDPALVVRVEAPRNDLEVDDRGFAWVARSQPIHVTVVGTETGWLRAAFERDPGVRATFQTPAEYAARGAARRDVLVLDRWAPAERPDVPALLFAPPAVTWLSASPGEARTESAPVEERRPRWAVPGTHPVVEGVDPFTLTIDRARSYGEDSLLPVARSAAGTPLVYVREGADRRMVLVTFGPHESNLAGAPGFPVLLGDALEWLGRPSFLAADTALPAPGPRHPGPAAFDRPVRRVRAPGGGELPLTPVGERTYAVLKDPGFYVAESATAQQTIAVNITDPQLSNLTHTNRYATMGTRAEASATAGRAWWVYCAVAALLLALTEWWTWSRRITV